MLENPFYKIHHACVCIIRYVKSGECCKTPWCRYKVYERQKSLKLSKKLINSHKKLRSQERFGIDLRASACNNLRSRQEQLPLKNCKTPPKATIYFFQQLLQKLLWKLRILTSKIVECSDNLERGKGHIPNSIEENLLMVP